MMGERTVMQGALFYEFDLERHVPADHLIRSIDRSPCHMRSESAFSRSGKDVFTFFVVIFSRECENDAWFPQVIF
jgi:hypothetical protein